MNTVTLLIYLSSYFLFFLINKKSIREGTQRLFDERGNFTSKPTKLIQSHLLGAFILGIIPFLMTKRSVTNLFDDITTVHPLITTFYFITFIALIVVAFKQSNYFHNRKEKSEKALRLSMLFFITYFLIRALYLFSYELWFRGGFLVETKSSLGLPLAILANVFLYVLLHMFNSKKEILACIPFGIITCLFCFFFNSAWPAILMHIAFSLIYEINYYRLNLIQIKNS